MTLRKAYRYRLKAKPASQGTCRRFAGCCRFVWNKALAHQKQLLAEGKPCLNYSKLAGLLPEWKREHQFLTEAPSQALQQTLMNLDKALRGAFDKKNPKRFPVFKKKHVSRDSFRYPQGFKLAAGRVFLPKLGWLNYYNSRPVEGVAKNVTVSRRGEHWYVSVQTEIEATPVHPSGSIVGVDRGVARFATLSDGSFHEPLNAFAKAGAKLAKLQRKLARQVKRSKNWQKQKRKITRHHIRIADMRSDYLHKLSTTISKNHAVVVLEGLRTASMTASARGSEERPGRCVRQKSGLNRVILDQGWRMFADYLGYKQEQRGGWVFFVDPAYTSQECSACGHIHKDNRKTQSSFACQACGLAMNADLNAAVNILRAGHARLACQASGALMPPATGTLKLAAQPLPLESSAFRPGRMST